MDLGTSGYEKIVGTIHFAVDPRIRATRSSSISTRRRATRRAASSSPPICTSSDRRRRAATAPRWSTSSIAATRSCSTAFNRGGSPDPATENDLGDRFLMRFGYTIVWVGLGVRRAGSAAGDADSRAGGDRRRHTDHRRRRAPRGRANTQRDRIRRQRSGERTTPSIPTARTVRCAPVRALLSDACTPIPRGSWRVRGHTVTLDRGFVPGTTYRSVIAPRIRRSAGLGFVAVRDYDGVAEASARRARAGAFAYGYGSSQSGRFLRGFLYEGFNTDEHDRQVFDGVMAHIAGASRLSLNERWAKPTGLASTARPRFPSPTRSLRDPVSGAQDGLLENARAGGHAPKVFYTNTPVEYWGTGRVAALVHTTPDGSADLTLPDNVRVYFIAGTQHSPSRFPPKPRTASRSTTRSTTGGRCARCCWRCTSG